MSDYLYKIDTFIKKNLHNIEKPQIVEFGVKEGRSTKLFLDICDNFDGKLTSIDVDDYSNLFKNKNWTFIKSRDDNFDYLEKDIIYLDSLHEADHVEKIFYHYFPKLKKNGFFFIDDTSWLPYLKSEERNNFYCEINNKETFERILSIYFSNQDNFDLEFNFISSGICKIKKKQNELNPKKKLIYRSHSIKNFIRKILKLINR